MVVVESTVGLGQGVRLPTVSTHLWILLLECAMLEVHEIRSTSAQAVHVTKFDERRCGVTIAEELQCRIP